MLNETNRTAIESTVNVNTRSRHQFRMGQNDRTAGSVPIWETNKSSYGNTQKTFVATLERTNLSPEHILDTLPNTQENAFAEIRTPHQQSNLHTNDQKDNFDFGDIIDIVNPLHHIPLVNYAYRKLTNDEIRPISEIVGGSIYGGATGGIAALANVVSKESTGKNLTENLQALIFDQQLPDASYSLKKNNTLTKTSDHPIDNINQALAMIEDSNAILSFTDLTQQHAINIDTKTEAKTSQPLHNHKNRYND